VLLVFVGLLFGVWEQNKLLRWRVENAGRQPDFQMDDFFSATFRAFLSMEFFVLQILPLVFFIRDRVREVLTRGRLARYAILGMAQVGFALFLVLRLNAALVWTASSQWFSAAIGLAALTNIWFGFRLLWHTGHEYRTLQSGGSTAEQPLALIRLVKYSPLFLLLAIEAVVCAVYASDWGFFFFCLGVVFGTNLLVLMGRMLWLARGEERIIYLPPLLLSGVMIILGLDSSEYRPRQIIEMFGMGLVGSAALFFLVRLERSLVPRVSPLAAKLKQKFGRFWRIGAHGFRALVVISVAGYLIEDWRGNRAWAKAKAELIAKGAHLDWEYYKPKPIPDDQNIMKVPIMETWFIKDSPLKNTPMAGRYKQLGEALNKTPSREVPPVELVLVSPDSKVEVPANAVVFDLADLQASRQRFAALNPHLPGGRYSLTANNTFVIERAPDLEQKVSPIYLRSATSQSLDQLNHLFKQYGLLEPSISSAETANGNVFRIELMGPSRQMGHAKTAKDLIQATDALKPEFDQIRAALRRPGYYLHSNSEVAWEAPIPNFVAARNLAQVLDARARSFLLLNRPAEAWQELAFMKDFCRCLESNSWTLVSAMIDVAIMGLYLSDIEQGYALRGWTADQAAEIQSELEKVNLIPLYQNCFGGERAASLQFLDLSRVVATKLMANSADPGVLFYHFIPRGWISQNMKLIALQHQRTIESIDVPGARFNPQMSALNQGALARELAYRTPYNFVAMYAMPNAIKAGVTVAKNQTRANLAACAFALERYRVKYGQYPEKLESLAPEFKAKVPHDIVNGEPLKYRREAPDRFILYSIGWDLKDEGGKTSDKSDQGDWVWTSAP
jgi:hypothetical protein